MVMYGHVPENIRRRMARQKMLHTLLDLGVHVPSSLHHHRLEHKSKRQDRGAHFLGAAEWDKVRLPPTTGVVNELQNLWTKE